MPQFNTVWFFESIIFFTIFFISIYSFFRFFFLTSILLYKKVREDFNEFGSGLVNSVMGFASFFCASSLLVGSNMSSSNSVCFFKLAVLGLTSYYFYIIINV